MKCNDSLTVLEVLASIGVGFDCASKSEINKILDIGVDPSKIIFANPTKPASHIRHAASVGVDLMTVDNEAELHKIKKLFPNAKVQTKIYSRFSLGFEPGLLNGKLTTYPVNTV